MLLSERVSKLDQGGHKGRQHGGAFRDRVSETYLHKPSTKKREAMVILAIPIVLQRSILILQANIVLGSIWH